MSTTISYAIQHTVTVDEIEIAPDVFVFRRSDSTLDTRALGKRDGTVTQGVTDRDGLAALRLGLEPKTKHFVVVADEILEDIRRFGYAGLNARNFKGIDDRDVYDWIEHGGSLDNIILIQSNDHTFWGVKGNLIPSAILFTYLDGKMNDFTYDFDRVKAVLVGRSDVTFVDTRGLPFGGSLSGGVTGEFPIAPIPHYNSNCGNYGATFFWTPTQEQAEQIQKRRADRYQIIFDNDMIGLRAGNAALFSNFWESREEEVEEDD